MIPNSSIIFTDGAARGNPGPGGWGAIIAHQGRVTELGGRESHTTNNRMELTAAIGALSFLSSGSNLSNSTLYIYADSSYLLNGITKWIYGWRKNNWINSQKEEVLNRDLWEKLFELTHNKKIEWNYIKGHAGIKANERSDEIATSFADNSAPVLYNGSQEAYSVSLDPTQTSGASGKKSKARSKKTAYSYVSLIDGKVMRHMTWEECKARVSGKSGARFKKTISPEDEKEVIAALNKK